MRRKFLIISGKIDGFLRKTKKRKFGSTICTANDADAVLRRKTQFFRKGGVKWP